MKIVIDTNVIFSYFFEKSIIKKIIKSNKLDLYTPEYTKKELLNYKNEIIKKAKINNKIFSEKLEELKKHIKFKKIDYYKKEINKIKDNIPDIKDIDFLALSYKLDKVLWTNDKQLKKQNKIIILTNKEIIYIISKINKKII